MNIQLAFKIADLAICLADRQLNGSFKGDPFFEETLLEIVQKAARAYQDHVGQPLDPFLIKPEDRA